MQTLIVEARRLWRDRTVRFGVALVAACGYAFVVLAGRVGTFLDLAAVALAATVLLWRRRPVVALAVGYAVLLAALVRGLTDVTGVANIAPFTAIVVPILGGALDDRRQVRYAAYGLAGLALLETLGWAQAGLIGQSGSLVLPSALLLALPLAAAAVWRRPVWRDGVVAFVRDRLPVGSDRSSRFRTLAVSAGVLYAVCVACDAFSGNPGIVLAALPLSAALPWAFERPDFSLGLAGVGLLLTAVLSVFSWRFGVGEALSLLAGTVPLAGAALSGSPLLQRLGMGLVGVAAVLVSGITGSAAYGVLVAVVGALPYFVVWAWRQQRANGGLRDHLVASRERERAAERDVLMEQERTRLAREVHDVVAHSLAVVIAQADGARYAAQADPATVGPALEAIADTARDALGEVRTMLHDLRTSGEGVVAPGAADLPALVEGLEALGVEMREAVYGEAAALDEQADAALYRIVQEALTNALRHGRRGSPIDLELDWGEQALVVVVANALPDEPREATERAGHGIPGMRERAALVGGECTAGIGSNGVFRVRASIPVPAPPREDEVASPAPAADAPVDVFAFLADPAGSSA